VTAVKGFWVLFLTILIGWSLFYWSYFYNISSMNFWLVL